jgi:hypothetical protein
VITEKRDVDPGCQFGAQDEFGLGEAVKHVRVVVQIGAVPALFIGIRQNRYLDRQFVQLAGLDNEINEFRRRQETAARGYLKNIAARCDVCRQLADRVQPGSAP